MNEHGGNRPSCGPKPINRKSLPWSGVAGGVLMASVIINILSLTLNSYQHQLLNMIGDEVADNHLPDLPDLGRDEEPWTEAGLFLRRLGERAMRRRWEEGAVMPSDMMDEDEPVTQTGHITSEEALARKLSGSSSSVPYCKTDPTFAEYEKVARDMAGSASGTGSGSGEHAHDYYAMLYLFNAIVIGAAVMQLSAKFPILQQTVVLFMIGFVVSLFLKGIKIDGKPMYEKMGIWGSSYKMWMGIDPHLLLFTLLPALLAGDAMTIDTSVARRVGLQCLYLAGPGVLIAGMTTMVFLKYYLTAVDGTNTGEEWSWLLSLCAGAILCATDPVAVVALLKELGASPMLTVQIQGESLLNDGTAIVLYLISYQMLQGETFDAADIAMFLVKKAMMAWALGLFIGYFFFSWIRAAANKLDHASGMIQITLTLCCAYWSFVLVEGVFHLSGVLATVASSLVLAHHMWPYVVAPDSLTHVWHTFESLGNIIIFFLAGCIIGSVVLDVPAINWLHLIVIYIFLISLRASLLFGSSAVGILKWLSADKIPVSWQDATLMTWGGLRGAVGLALAIQVQVQRAAYSEAAVMQNGEARCKDWPGHLGECSGSASKLLFGQYMIGSVSSGVYHYADSRTDPDPCHYKGVAQISQAQADQLIFFVGGIAFLTTLVNATTAPFLVKKLGITASSQARQSMLKMFNSQLVEWSENTNNPPDVTKSLQHMLEEISHHIDHEKIADKGPVSQRTLSDIEEKANPSGGAQSNKVLVDEIKAHEERYKTYKPEQLSLLGDEMPENLLCQVDDMKELIATEWVDEGMAKVVNQTFLTLVYNNYWKLIESGNLRPGSGESDVLLTSVRISLSPYRPDLTDFEYVLNKVDKSDEFNGDESGDALGALGAELAEADDTAVEDVSGQDGAVTSASKVQAPKGCLFDFISSSLFSLTVAVAILLNGIQVVVEEIWRTPDNDDNIAWIVLDSFFTAIFLIEFVLKFLVLKLRYFKDNWNRFDFFLVVIGIAGVIMSITLRGASSKVAGHTRIIRVARVLRTLRFLRIFRLFHARMSKDVHISIKLAKHLKKITTLNCFIRAHCQAQKDIVRYFGGNGKIDEAKEAELARCVLQSQAATYKSLDIAVRTQADLEPEIVDELRSLYKRKTITEGFSNYVLQAHADGAISGTEAHAILHPLHHMIADCIKELNDRSEGVLHKGNSGHGHGDGHGGGHGGSSPKGHGGGHASPIQVVTDVKASDSAIRVEPADDPLPPATNGS